MTQLSLFPEYDITLDNINEFKKAIKNGIIDNLCIYSLARTAYNRSKMRQSLLAVDELTIIPAWKSMCGENDRLKIEKSPNHGLYMHMINGKITNVTNNAYTLLTENDIRAIYAIWLHN